ncbi:BH3-interacting domain death agonist isoform X3 [Bos taurus]|uniref:BH3-interacting domain death agonist isoform X3 n=1 Tax=Bos taurus TaxID=9913 RepID=UPI0028CBB9A9|nr:BH3-interacting domain death agonist isoform X3 [Bos taurus]
MMMGWGRGRCGRGGNYRKWAHGGCAPRPRDVVFSRARPVRYVALLSRRLALRWRLATAPALGTSAPRACCCWASCRAAPTPASRGSWRRWVTSCLGTCSMMTSCRRTATAAATSPWQRKRRQDRRQCLAAALEQLMQTCPPDVDHEKTQLLLTMLLAKKIADHSPALLRDVFHTTVTFINQNLLAYVRNLVRNQMD